MMSTQLSQNSVNIRPYRGDVDFPGLVAFLAMMFEHEREHQHIPRHHGGTVAPHYAQELVRTIEGRLGCLLIAEVGANPVGFIAAYRMSDPDPVLDESMRDHGYVRDLFILPNWRKMGVASRLVEQVEDHFRKNGVTRLRIAGVAQNAGMIGLCKSAGFDPYAVVYERGIPTSDYELVDGKIIKGTH